MSQTPKYQTLASQTLYETAVELIESHNFVAAQSALDMLYQTEPIDPEGHIFYGLTYLHSGQLDQASLHLKQAADGGLQDDVTFLFLSGRLCYELDDHERAKSLFEKVLDINPNQATAHINLGHIYFEEGQLEEAETHYLAALESPYANREIIQTNLSYIYHKQGDLEKAIDCMQRALKAPSSAKDHAHLGHLFLEAGRYAEGLKQDTMALALDPLDVNARGNYAIALERAGQDPDLVLRAVESTLKIGSDNAVIHTQAAIILSNIGMPERADDTYKKALELAGQDTNPIKSYLCRNWDLAIRQNRTYAFIAERLAGLGVPVVVPHAPLPHAPLLSFGT